MGGRRCRRAIPFNGHQARFLYSTATAHVEGQRRVVGHPGLRCRAKREPVPAPRPFRGRGLAGRHRLAPMDRSRANPRCDSASLASVRPCRGRRHHPSAYAPLSANGHHGGGAVGSSMQAAGDAIDKSFVSARMLSLGWPSSICPNDGGLTAGRPWKTWRPASRRPHRGGVWTVVVRTPLPPIEPPRCRGGCRGRRSRCGPDPRWPGCIR